MNRSLRFDGESDDAFRDRAERAAQYGRILIDSALANHEIRALIADPAHPLWTEAGERANPTVRIDYEQAICIAAIGEGLAATKNKHWGDGPCIQPLEPDDPVDPMFVTYVFKENSIYHCRFEQRRRMKELLGRRYRPLVQRAKYHRQTKKMFLESLTSDQANAIRRAFAVEPGEFWRAARGKIFLDLPPRLIQLELPFEG